jgi:hypothetical protein
MSSNVAGARHAETVQTHVGGLLFVKHDVETATYLPPRYLGICVCR